MNTIVTKDNFEASLKDLSRYTVLVIDVETTGLKAFNADEIFGIGVAGSRGGVFYFPFRHQSQIVQKSLLEDSTEDVVYENLPEEYIKPLIDLMNSAKALVGYNVKFDIRFLLKEGLIPWDKELIDGLVAVRLTEVDQYPKMGLSEIISKSYGESHSKYDVDTKNILRKNKWQKNYSLAPIEVIGPYCMEDVYWARQITLDRIKQLKGSRQEAIWNMEKSLTKVLLRMEYKGISVDLDYCERAFAICL